jgi:hypothetical protein
MENLTFLGCKMTSDSLTTNSLETPDGKPVIEIFAADANVLIYTSTTAIGGNLSVGALTNQPATYIDLQELYVWKFVKHQLLKEYNAEKKAFRKKLGKLTKNEMTRRAEFISRIETDVIRREYEDLRRIEFDVVNKDLEIKIKTAAEKIGILDINDFTTYVEKTLLDKYGSRYND